MSKGIILMGQPFFEPASSFWADVKTKIEALSDGREVVITKDKNLMKELAGKVEITFSDVDIDIMELMPNLKWVQIWSAGADRFKGSSLWKNDSLIITSTSGIHRNQIAQHIFALLFAWTRGIKEAVLFQNAHKWERVSTHPIDIVNGKTMLILGYGQIGEQTALSANTFGMKVIGVRRHKRDDEKSAFAKAHNIELTTESELPAQLPRADYVVNILPLAADTENFFTSAHFSAMKPGAVYINVGRGATTDQDALIANLQNKHLGAALLDVTEPEPLPQSSPLWDFENVILTSHYAGLSPDYHEKALKIALENLQRYNKGEPLVNVINRKLGY